ncbi:MAG TPA: hypothetical protein VKG25_18120 [Bryobacteraceae bacterium]|nr:hypothetical protein [Bryobacteraceae bacterium]
MPNQSYRLLFYGLLALTAARAGVVSYHTETKVVEGGAELVTVFADSSAFYGSLPVLTVLRDTAGDPDRDNSKLRQVWLLTYARPTLSQRLAALVPFLYRRSHRTAVDPTKPPPAVMDLSAPRKAALNNMASYAAQIELLDVAGIAVRATSRTYRGNSTEYENMHLQQAFKTLSSLDSTSLDRASGLGPVVKQPIQPEGVTEPRPSGSGPEVMARLFHGGYLDKSGTSDFSQTELENVAARLVLDKKLFGGFVSDRRLSAVYEKTRTEEALDREHNWEVLRQRAETNGLYFEPLTLGQNEPAQALLWIAKPDLEAGRDHAFDGTLLKIRDPWKDERLSAWQGYGERWYFDAENRRVPDETPGSIERDMIPLALYGLNYPRAPLLLVDFRNDWNPKRREMLKRIADITASGFLGWNGLANLEYFAGKKVWQFVQGRHGDAINREWRIDAYAQLRQELELDSTLNADLKETITSQLDRLALNPFDIDLKAEANVARTQYAALLRWAGKPNGLPRALEKARGSELAALHHDSAARALFTTASVATLGIYRHRERVTPETLAELDRNRRIEARLAYLERVLRSGPSIEVSYQLEPVRKAVEELADLNGEAGDPRIRPVVRRVSAQTGDTILGPAVASGGSSLQ